jgi:hypothetical protein
VQPRGPLQRHVFRERMIIQKHAHHPRSLRTRESTP